MLTLNSPTEVKPLKLPNIVCALGVFDGLHLGHQRIIEALIHKAKDIKGTSTIITFDKHPYTILNPSYQVPLLTSSSHKLKLLDELGIDVCILTKFNRTTASITAETWIKEILWSQLHINSIYIGEDSFFGKNREGDIDLLRQWGRRLGFGVNTIETTRVDKTPISSTLIRDCIRKGDIELAKRFLGRNYSVLGAVVPGTGRGKELGFPTANLNTKNQCLPSDGVYIAWVKVNNKISPAVANIGIRPTFTPHQKKQPKPILEVYLLEGTNELYNKELEVIFIKKLRNEIKFTEISELTLQIEKDIASVKKALGR